MFHFYEGSMTAINSVNPRSRLKKVSGGKHFFFEKKKRKTSIHGTYTTARAHTRRADEIRRYVPAALRIKRRPLRKRAKRPGDVFCFFFSKKKRFP
jgi:hypothetical protein